MIDYKPQHTEFVAEGVAEFYDSGALAAKPGAVLPAGLASSTHYDVKLIVWHLLYRGYVAGSCEVWRGRGNTYNVCSRGGRRWTATISDYKDFRGGVSLLPK